MNNNPLQDMFLSDNKKNKDTQIKNLISLLGENMPSDPSSSLGKQLNSIMSLRLLLLRTNRIPEEEQLVDTILVLFESYLAAGRTRQDIALLVTRDFSFHMQHQQRVSLMYQQSIQQQATNSIGSPMIQSRQHQLHQNFSHPPTTGGFNSNSFVRGQSSQVGCPSTSVIGNQHQSMMQFVGHLFQPFVAQQPMITPHLQESYGSAVNHRSNAPTLTPKDVPNKPKKS